MIGPRQVAMDAAYLVSPILRADPGEAGGCRLRVFYHMHGITFYRE